MSEADPKPVTFLDRWTRLSLARRIMLAAAIWGLIVLIGGALALSALYRAQTLSLLSDELDQTLITLTRDMTREGAFLADGRVTDDNHVFLSTDSRYQTQYSGRYWAIVAVDEDGAPTGDLRSRSLWDEPVPMSPRLLKRELPRLLVHRLPLGETLCVQRLVLLLRRLRLTQHPDGLAQGGRLQLIGADGEVGPRSDRGTL